MFLIKYCVKESKAKEKWKERNFSPEITIDSKVIKDFFLQTHLPKLCSRIHHHLKKKNYSSSANVIIGLFLLCFGLFSFLPCGCLEKDMILNNLSINLSKD